MSRPALQKEAIKAAIALKDLNIFAAVQTLMERSLVSSRHFGAEARIVAICKTEQAKCLIEYDVALSRVCAP